ncbi:MAG: hypothetical protein RMK97_06315 [Sutterellaceae bacterium]|nr:hypothetical protein [Burkholderiaceae bacterium]MDW8430101.1 hypothetical protein [Sutterellaceae bacterium]
MLPDAPRAAWRSPARAGGAPRLPLRRQAREEIDRLVLMAPGGGLVEIADDRGCADARQLIRTMLLQVYEQTLQERQYLLPAFVTYLPQRRCWPPRCGNHTVVR